MERCEPTIEVHFVEWLTTTRIRNLGDYLWQSDPIISAVKKHVGEGINGYQPSGSERSPLDCIFDRYFNPSRSGRERESTSKERRPGRQHLWLDRRDCL